MKLFASLLAACLLFGTTGCASILKSRYQNLAVTSDPSDARVSINGILVGKTPLVTSVNGTKEQVVEISKEGYGTRLVVVTTSIGAGWIIADVLTGVAPLIVDAATGSWNSLDNSVVNIALDKK